MRDEETSTARKERLGQPAPGRRLGPRPLPMHLISAIGVSTSSIGASIGLKNGLIPWHPSLRGQVSALHREVRALAKNQPDQNQNGKKPPQKKQPPNDPPNDPLGALNPNQPDFAAFWREQAVWAAFTGAVQREASDRMGQMLAGIQRYRHHPYQRRLEDPPTLWAEGTTRLLDFRGLRPQAGKGSSSARGAVMLVPSLVNRGYVLDLTAECSLARWLAAQDIDVFLIDWGAPGADERDFALAQYITRLGRAAGASAEAAGRPIGLLGYCMGGLLTLPLVAGFMGQMAAVDRMVLLATPWDFHAERKSQAQILGAMGRMMEPLMATTGQLPTDTIQALFGMLDPFLAMKKFAAFARMDPDSARAIAFVALEDWLNDGVPLAAPVARECLGQWYGDNQPGAGRWRLSGFPVRPQAVTVPTLALVPAGDRIVPPKSAVPLADAIPGCELLRPNAGHIGMIVGRGAEPKVWEPIRAFLAQPPKTT